MMNAAERNARANSRDFQIDADTLRQQATRLRQPRKGAMLAQAETWELESASWLMRARQFTAMGMLADLHG